MNEDQTEDLAISRAEIAKFQNIMDAISIERSILHKTQLAKKGTVFYIARYKCKVRKQTMSMVINVNSTGMSESQEASIKRDLKRDLIRHFKLT